MSHGAAAVPPAVTDRRLYGRTALASRDGTGSWGWAATVSVSAVAVRLAIAGVMGLTNVWRTQAFGPGVFEKETKVFTGVIMEERSGFDAKKTMWHCHG
jgi:hypothetical protein